MNEQEKLEACKMIAEYMGYEIRGKEYILKPGELFHTSWLYTSYNHIMPVVEKVLKEGRYELEVCHTNYLGEEEYTAQFSSPVIYVYSCLGEADTLPEAIFLCVVDYLKNNGK